MTIALGIDFEKITHTPAYRSRTEQQELECDIIDVGERLLSLFSRYGVTTTFFIVSEIVEEHSEFIRRITESGHEVASHTLSHQSLTDISYETKASEIKNSKEQLESVSGEAVSGFRAPTCRIDDDAYKLLIDAGYEYSSTIMPSVPIPGFYSNEYGFDHVTEVNSDEDAITEVPLSVSRRLNLPISGAWIRLLGRRYFHRNIKSFVEAGIPVVTYSHPWEFTDLRNSPLPFRCRIHTGEWLFETYESLLQMDAEFTTVSDIASRQTPKGSYSLPNE